MDGRHDLAGRFEAHRALAQLAYRMLGSRSEAEDAVQEGRLRLARTDAAHVENLAAWLRTVVSRVCLDVLRARASRREELVGERVSDAVRDPGHDLRHVAAPRHGRRCSGPSYGPSGRRRQGRRARSVASRRMRRRSSTPTVSAGARSSMAWIAPATAPTNAPTSAPARISSRSG